MRILCRGSGGWHGRGRYEWQAKGTARPSRSRWVWRAQPRPDRPIDRRRGGLTDYELNRLSHIVRAAIGSPPRDLDAANAGSSKVECPDWRVGYDRRRIHAPWPPDARRPQTNSSCRLVRAFGQGPMLSSYDSSAELKQPSKRWLPGWIGLTGWAPTSSRRTFACTASQPLRSLAWGSIHPSPA